MAEIIGLVASLITLAQVAVAGVKVAKTLYQAPDELATLQVIFHSSTPPQKKNLN